MHLHLWFILSFFKNSGSWQGADITLLQVLRLKIIHQKQDYTYSDFFQRGYVHSEGKFQRESSHSILCNGKSWRYLVPCTLRKVLRVCYIWLRPRGSSRLQPGSSSRSVGIHTLPLPPLPCLGCVLRRRTEEKLIISQMIVSDSVCDCGLWPASSFSQPGFLA